MSGVWTYNYNGVIRLVNGEGSDQQYSTSRRKVLVYLPTGEVITSHETLERILIELGWEKNYDETELIQFNKKDSVDKLISLPKDFSKLTSVHMYDIVIKNPKVFEVRGA